MPHDLDFLDKVAKAGAAQLATTTTLTDFLTTERRLGRRERQAIVREALWMLEGAYVHLPQKRAMYAVDPLQQLRLMDYRLEETPDERLPSDLEFHREMSRLFTSLRDLHTNYLLPSPYRETVAYLPFLIEEHCDEEDQWRYVVSKVMPGYDRPPFGEGVEVIDWNGVPIRRAVELIADLQAGSNPAARHACGLDALTIRPLIRVLPPDERWVVLGYRRPQGKRLELKQDWLAFVPDPDGPRVASGPSPGAGLAIGLDLQASLIQESRKLFFARGAMDAARRVIDRGAPQSASSDALVTWMPTVFRAQKQSTKSGDFGYVRIFTFMVTDADAFVKEFIRLIEALPRDGLILDVRGNSGGLIWAAERLLQLLTPQQIEPERFQFINSPLTLALCRRFDDLGSWAGSIAQSVETGALYSQSYPISDKASCNAIGQRYFGPVVLITDAVCFSATDMFAAGFQDHLIGRVLGTSENTGAGGANVWRHAELRDLARVAGAGPSGALPSGAEMRVAIRRSLRVGAEAGVPVEDLGIRPDSVHKMTYADLLKGNVDLLDAAGAVLRDMPRRWLEVEVKNRTQHRLRVTVKATGIHSLEVHVDGRPQPPVDISSGAADLLIRLPGAKPACVELRGFDRDHKLVACYRMQPE